MRSILSARTAQGSWVRREVGKAHQENPGDVLGMDMDLKQKLSVGPSKKRQIVDQLTQDSEVCVAKMRATLEPRPDSTGALQFFQSLNIIDYSLLLGIHKVVPLDDQIVTQATSTTTSSSTAAAATTRPTSTGDSMDEAYGQNDMYVKECTSTTLIEAFAP